MTRYSSIGLRTFLFVLFLAFVLVLLSGCNGNGKYLALAETAGDYPAPIDRKQWVYTVYGFYLSRDTHIQGDSLVYQALFDNRQTKADMMRQYAVTDRFKKEYPAFVRYQGKVECKTKTGQALATRLDSSFKPLGTLALQDTQELSGALCMLKDLTNQ